jgi:DNA-binding MarR family transcriptional regulator
MMLSTSAPVDVANELRPVLLQLARRLRKELAPLGITAGQATLLWQVKRKPGIGVGGLALLEGVSQPAMSGHVDRLEAAGLLRRDRSSEDRRRVGLALTEAGAKVLRSARRRRTAWLAEGLANLAPDELEAVERAIPHLARMLNGRP